MNATEASSFRERAEHLCEYCHLPEALSELRFVFDHIIARQHDGETISDNLALCCGFCNRHKGPNVAGIDPESRVLTRLFHPRQDRWNDHFRWDGARVVGLTAIGRTTIHVLAINHPIQLAIRGALLAEAVFTSGAAKVR